MLLELIILVDESAFWNKAALTMLSSYWVKRSALWSVYKNTGQLIPLQFRAYPGESNDDIIPASEVFMHTKACKCPHTKYNCRYCGESPCYRRGLRCDLKQRFGIHICSHDSFADECMSIYTLDPRLREYVNVNIYIYIYLEKNDLALTFLSLTKNPSLTSGRFTCSFFRALRLVRCTNNVTLLGCSASAM